MTGFLAASLLFVLAQAGVPTLEVRPSTSNVSIGERFQVTVEARGATGTAYEFPKEITGGPVELRWSRPATGQADVAVYDAQAFAIGEAAQIPEVEVGYTLKDGGTGTVKTSMVPLNVVSILDPNEQDPKPADLAPPVPVLVSRAFWIASGLASLLVLAGLIALARRIRFPKKPVDPRVTPAASPEEEAMAGLDRLASSGARGEAKAFYITLIQILKLYLERRLEAPILEMTSTEALGFIKTHAWTAPHAVALRDLISSADLVKFGGFSDAPNADRHLQLVRDTVSRIDRLRRAALQKQTDEAEVRKTA